MPAYAKGKAIACPFGVADESTRRIMWEITYKCNLRCKHCCTKAGKKSEDELSFAQVKDVLGQFPENGLNGVYFTGGEPLMREDIFDILRAAAGKKMRVSLASNGTLITKDVAKRLVSSGVNSVHVSLDDIRPAYHDAFVGKEGAFDSTVLGIKNLIGVGGVVKVDYMVTNANYPQIEEFLEFVRKLGVKYVIVSSVFNVGRAKGNKKLFLNKRERSEVDRTVVNMKKKYSGTLNLYYARSTVQGKSLPLTVCPGGKHWFHLDGIGNMSPCSYVTKEDKSFMAGNVKHERLSEILSSDKIKKFRALVKERGNLNECASCELRNECGFGCPVLSKIESGSYENLDSLCTVAKTRLK